jgi:hypothetical protein
VFPNGERQARKNVGVFVVPKNPIATMINTRIATTITPLFSSSNAYIQGLTIRRVAA